MRNISTVLLLACASVTAYSQVAISQLPDAVNPPFTLTISFNATNAGLETTTDQVMKSGNWVSFVIRKTNITDHEILRYTDESGHYCCIEVRNSNGDFIGWRKSYEEEDRSTVTLIGDEILTLKPGESTVNCDPIGSWFDMDKPGRYTVQVASHISEDPNSAVVKSNIITITVLPADPPPPAQQ